MVYRNFTSSPAAGFSIDLQFDHDVLEVCVCAPRLFINNIIINPWGSAILRVVQNKVVLTDLYKTEFKLSERIFRDIKCPIAFQRYSYFLLLENIMFVYKSVQAPFQRLYRFLCIQEESNTRTVFSASYILLKLVAMKPLFIP